MKTLDQLADELEEAREEEAQLQGEVMELHQRCLGAKERRELAEKAYEEASDEQ